MEECIDHGESRDRWRRSDRAERGGRQETVISTVMRIEPYRQFEYDDESGSASPFVHGRAGRGYGVLKRVVCACDTEISVTSGR